MPLKGAALPVLMDTRNRSAAHQVSHRDFDEAAKSRFGLLEFIFKRHKICLAHPIYRLRFPYNQCVAFQPNIAN